MSIHLHRTRQMDGVDSRVARGVALRPLFRLAEIDGVPSYVTGRVMISGRPVNDMTICLDSGGVHVRVRLAARRRHVPPQQHELGRTAVPSRAVTMRISTPRRVARRYPRSTRTPRPRGSRSTSPRTGTISGSSCLDPAALPRAWDGAPTSVSARDLLARPWVPDRWDERPDPGANPVSPDRTSSSGRREQDRDDAESRGRAGSAIPPGHISRRGPASTAGGRLVQRSHRPGQGARPERGSLPGRPPGQDDARSVRPACPATANRRSPRRRAT